MGIYAISDLHGRYDLWTAVKEYLYEKDTLYCLGDSIDRGHYGLNILLEMIDRPNTYMLMGNHEQMMVEYFEKNQKRLIPNLYYYEPYSIWFMNGGRYTFDQIEEKITREGDLLELLDIVRDFDTDVHIKNAKGQTIILNHCGYTPGLSYEPYWDRYHLTDSWPEDMDDVYIVHGHTPVQYMSRYRANGIDDYLSFKVNPRVAKYANGHKINIDLGSVTSNKTVLLNLDTLEPIYFYNEYVPDEIDKIEQEIAEEEAKMGNDTEVFPFL